MTDSVKDKAGNFGADILDGSMAGIGMKDDVVIDSIGKRIGVNLLPFAAGVFTQGALTRVALAKVDQKSANAIVEEIPGGAVTVRKL